MSCRNAGIALAAVLLVLLGAVAWLLNKPRTADCSVETPARHAAHEIRAIKAVVLCPRALRRFAKLINWTMVFAER